MAEHVCGAFTGKKLVGCCLCCSSPVYDILETFAAGPRDGEARRVGLMLEHGTQLEILLSDGSACHFDFCVACATNLTPENLWDVWQRNVERVEAFARMAGRREVQRRAIMRVVARVYPVGVLRWRRQDRELVGAVPDGLVVDRRRPHAMPETIVEDRATPPTSPRKAPRARRAARAAGPRAHA